MSELVSQERRELVKLMARLGPDAPTLCTGWTIRDLAAHLVVRERRPDSALGLVASPLANWTERVRQKYARQEFVRLLALLEEVPTWSPLSAPIIDSLANTIEFFVHHEDVRRAQPGWQQRPLSHRDEEELWGSLGIARVLLRRTKYAVKVVCPRFGQRTFGKGEVGATITGAPSEVLLYCFGRKEVAHVNVTGAAATNLAQATLGL